MMLALTRERPRAEAIATPETLAAAGSRA